MIDRIVLAVVAIELIIAAPLAYWLMWRFAFRGEEAYAIGNTLIALTILLPIIGGIFFYLRRENHKDA